MTHFVTGHACGVFGLRDRAENRRASFASRVVAGRGMARTCKRGRRGRVGFSRVGGHLTSYSLGTAFFSSVAGPDAEFMGSIICATITLFNTIVTVGNGVAINVLSDFLTCTARCAGPFGRVDNIMARLRGSVTYTNELLSLVRRARITPSVGRGGILSSPGNSVGLRGISFDCIPSGGLVRGLGISIYDNVQITVMNPANYNGAALVGLLVGFCSISTNDVDISKVSCNYVGIGSLHSSFKVILRSA